jgi:uncharacterized protein YjbJ (UPF0337 family)
MKSSANDKVEGTAKNIAGTVKEVAGKATGNDRLKSAPGKGTTVRADVPLNERIRRK